MRDWVFWEWVAYSALFVAAIITAADQGVKLSSEMLSRFSVLIGSPYWAFAPLMLVLLATGILFSYEMGWIGSGKQPKFAFSNKPATEIVQDRQFNNERVVIDGKSFRNCKFTNVTFVYNGTASFDLIGTDIYGSRWFSSDNPAIIGTVILLKGIGFNPEVAELNAPPGIHVEPPKHVP
jgi:hypothetical protein